MRFVQFGSVESLEIRYGEPAFGSALRGTHEINFGRGSVPVNTPEKDDFEL